MQDAAFDKYSKILYSRKDKIRSEKGNMNQRMIFEKEKRVRCEGRGRAPSLQGHSGNHTALALYPHCCASLLKLPLPAKVLNFINLILVPERHDLKDSSFSLCSECQYLKFKVYLHICL